MLAQLARMMACRSGVVLGIVSAQCPGPIAAPSSRIRIDEICRPEGIGCGRGRHDDWSACFGGRSLIDSIWSIEATGQGAELVASAESWPLRVASCAAKTTGASYSAP